MKSVCRAGKCLRLGVKSALLLLVCALLAAGLSACVARPLAAAPEPVKAKPDTVQHASDYQAWLQTQTPEALAAELARLDATSSARAAMEKALLLARRHAPADLAAALAQLDAVLLATTEDAPPWQPLARLLQPVWQADLQEQKRLQEQLEKQASQLRDSQRKVDQLNEKVEQLDHKLEALKSIELNLPKPAGNTPPASLPGPAAVPAPASLPAASRSPAS